MDRWHWVKVNGKKQQNKTKQIIKENNCYENVKTIQNLWKIIA